MTNLMREHMPSTSRMHYIITDGGRAPNIVPERAQVYYYVRHPRPETVEELFERVVAAAEGAALGTGTHMSYEVMHGNFPLLPNESLAKVMHEHLKAAGGVAYDEDETAFAASHPEVAVRQNPTAVVGPGDPALRISAEDGIHGCRRRELDRSHRRVRHRNLGPGHHCP